MCYRGGKKKIDDLYSRNHKKSMRSLFGNIMSTGIDEDHQHGIELPAARELVDDESVSEEEASINDELSAAADFKSHVSEPITTEKSYGERESEEQHQRSVLR